MPRGKNLKDNDVCWAVFSSSILNFSFAFKKSSVYFIFCHCGCFCLLVDVRGGRSTAARPVKGHRSPRFLVVWRDPSFASK